MSPELNHQVRTIFDKLIQLPERERISYLREACSGRPELTEEVLRLLDAHQAGSSFLRSTDTVQAPDSQKIGRYIIHKPVGRGSMGKVYEAQDPYIDRIVAIKTIDLHGDDLDFMRDRLSKEAKSLGRLGHPNIVTVYDVEPAAEVPYIVMEFVEGKSLQDLIDGGATFSIEQVLEILRQAANALDYAHERQVVHRDIKPGNLMLQKEHVVKVTDFGIAKRKAPGLGSTDVYRLLGTPFYMSPEQFSAAPVDGRSDQYSLAVLAFQLLTGDLPFKASTITELNLAIAGGDRPSVRSVNPSLPASLDAPLHRAMEISPDDRFPTCKEFVAALDASAAVSSQWGAATEKTGRRESAIPTPVPKTPGRRIPQAVVWSAAAAAVVYAGALIYRNYVSPPPPLSPVIVAFTAEPGTVKPNDPVTLRWNVSDAARIIIDQGIGKIAAAGSVQVRPSTSTRYTLTASGAGTERSATVEVRTDLAPPAPPPTPVAIAMFRADPPEVVTGQHFQLIWNITGAAKASINPGAESVGPSGALDRTADQTTTYTIAATPEAGGPAVTATTTVLVRPREQQQKQGAPDKPVRPRDALEEAAQRGDPKAMFQLGKASLNGAGRDADPRAAEHWLRKAAAAGEISAMMLLGSMYSEGGVVNKSGPEALRWFRQAADAGNARAMDTVGDMYWAGTLIGRNPSEAVRWHEKAAQAGSATAKYHLGMFYEQGQLVTRDLVRARGYYADAALQGSADARTGLARLQSLTDRPSVTVTGIQPGYIQSGRSQQYKVTGSGFTVRSTVTLDVPGRVGSRQDKPDYRAAEVASDGTWLKLFISVDGQVVRDRIRIAIRNPGSREAYLDVSVSK